MRVTADANTATAREAVSSRLAVGQVLGRYRIDAALGVGGMGQVFRARDLDLDRDVALKIAVRADHRERDQRRAVLLLREARAMAKLRARHVRAVHDVGSLAGIDYVAMEYVDGVDLAQWLATPRPLDAIARVFADAGRGLAAAHAAGLLHRDVKPSNVLVGRDGEVVVTDFGLSRWRDDHDPADRAGTPHYLAPDADAPEPRTDQYSFCVALGEAIGPSRDARVWRQLAAIARRGTSADRDARYPDMMAVVAAIEAARTPARTRWSGIAMIAVVAAIAVIAVNVGIARVRPANQRPLRLDDAIARIAAGPVDLALAEATALGSRGFFRSARYHAQAAVDHARRHAPARLAAAQYALGVTALDADDVATARTALDAAAQLADERGDDPLRARALVSALRIAVTRASDPGNAERAERAAAAALARIEPDRATRAMFAFLRGLRAALRGDDATARAAFAQARDAVAQPTLDELVLWGEVRRTDAALADAGAASATLRDVIATAERIGGAGHVIAISARGDLARALERGGRDAEANAVMRELRDLGRAAVGVRLLDELGLGPRPTRDICVEVRDARGEPIAGATVTAATWLHANGDSVLGAASLYTERERGLAIGRSDARGRAMLAATDAGPLWIAAEHAELGRAPIVPARRDACNALALAPWASLRATAPSDATVLLVPAARPQTPPIVLHAPRGAIASERIPRGDYLAAVCLPERIGAAVPLGQRCEARRITTGAAPLALALRTGDVTLNVEPRDELQRPIESSELILAPGDYAPPDLAALADTWLATAARHPGAPITWLTLHGTAARLTNLPPGRYTLCATAIHGDTEDPSFTARLEARGAPIPLHCAPLVLAPGVNTHTFVIPAAHRVWLGDAPAPRTTARQITALPSRW